MAIPVLTAVTGAVWEADLVSELDDPPQPQVAER